MQFSDGQKDTTSLRSIYLDNRTKCLVIKVNCAKLEIALKWSNIDQFAKFAGLDPLKFNCLQLLFYTFGWEMSLYSSNQLNTTEIIMHHSIKTLQMTASQRVLSTALLTPVAPRCH